MAPIGTLWGSHRQPQSKVILSVAALNGFELDMPEWAHKNKPAAFTDKFSYGKIPAFEGTDGFRLVEGATIARYVCGLGNKVNLLGSNAKECALVDQWTHFVEQEVGSPAHQLMGLIFGFAGPFNRETLDKHVECLFRGLNHVEAHLGTCASGYLVGDAPTLADFFLAGMMYGCSYAALGAAERAKYPNVFKHYAKVTGHEKVKHLWSTEGFAEVAVREPKELPEH